MRWLGRILNNVRPRIGLGRILVPNNVRPRIALGRMPNKVRPCIGLGRIPNFALVFWPNSRTLATKLKDKKNPLAGIDTEVLVYVMSRITNRDRDRPFGTCLTIITSYSAIMWIKFGSIIIKEKTDMCIPNYYYEHLLIWFFFCLHYNSYFSLIFR